MGTEIDATKEMSENVFSRESLPLSHWTNPAIQPNWKDLYMASSEENRTSSAVRIASLCSSWSAIHSKFPPIYEMIV